MPDIDLEPSDYAEHDPKSGKWKRPLSKRAARNWFFVCVAPLLFFLWRVNELQPATAFGVGVVSAFCAGVFAAYWLRDIY